MSLTTADEILDLWARNETPEAKAERRAVEALKKDIQTAQDSIQDAVSRYRKAKLRTRSKAKANSEDIFRPLEEYDSQVDIQNAYGYEMITETEYDRLMELWELRAQSVQKAGPYKDRVVEMLELAGPSGTRMEKASQRMTKKYPKCTGKPDGSHRKTFCGIWIPKVFEVAV